MKILGDAVAFSHEKPENHGQSEKLIHQWEDFLAQAQKVPAGGPINTPALNLTTIVDVPPGSRWGTGGHLPFNPNGDPDQPLPRWHDYGPEWAALIDGALGDKDELLASLRAPLDAAQTISHNWDRYNLGDIDWNSLPDTLPPDVANAIRFVNDNPALLKAISGPDGKVTKESVGDFIGKAQADLAEAGKHYKAWKEANPDAGPLATQIARSSAIMEANNTLLGGQYSAADLANFAANNPGLSASLTGAAQLWSRPGMFRYVDQAGQNVLSNNDGLANGGNFGAFLEMKMAPGSDEDAMDFIVAAAGRGAVPNVDISNLDGDIFVHPENYSAEQKAAVLQLLQDTKVKYLIADENGFIDPDTQKGDGVNTSWVKTGGDLDKKIAILQNDEDVKAYLSANTVPSLQAIVNADPGVRDAILAGYERYKSGTTLTDLLNRKDENGNPIPQPDAIAMFVSQGGFYQLATGENGEPGPSIDLVDIAKKSGSYQQILDYYKSNIVTAKDLKDLASVDPATAPLIFALEVEDYASVIDPADLDDPAELAENMNTVLFANLTPENLELVFGDGQGGIDDTKVKLFADAVAQQQPGLSQEDRERIAAAVFDGVKSFISAVRNGTGAVLAWKEITTGEAPKSGGWSILSLPENYRLGVLHGMNSIFGAIGLALSKSANGVRTPEEIAQTAFQAVIPTSLAITGVSNATIYLTQRKLDANAGAAAKAREDEANAERDRDAKKLEVETAQREYDEAVRKRDGLIRELRDIDRSMENYPDDERFDALRDQKESELIVANQDVAVKEKVLSGKKEELTNLEKDYKDAHEKVIKVVGDNHIYELKTKSRIDRARRIANVSNSFVGVGGIVAGSFSIFNATKHPGDKAQRGMAIASGAYSIFNGLVDLADGLVPLLGKRLGSFARMAPVFSFASSVVTVVGAGLGFALTIYDVVTHFQKEKQLAVSTTKDLNRTLIQFGVNGGPQTPDDDFALTPFADGLGEPPNTTAPGNQPPPANAPRRW